MSLGENIRRLRTRGRLASRLAVFVGWLCDGIRLGLLAALLTAAVRGRKRK